MPRRDARRTTGSALDRRQPESLLQRRQYDRDGARVEVPQHLVGHEAGEEDPIREAARRNGSAQGVDVGMKDVGGEISDQKQPSRRILSGRAGERPNERDEILVRVEAADVQEVRIPRREAARAQPLLARRALANRLEDRCRSLGSDADHIGRKAKMLLKAAS